MAAIANGGLLAAKGSPVSSNKSGLLDVATTEGIWKEEDGKWAGGQNGLLHLRSAKNDYYTCVVCCIQNRNFAMGWK